LGYDLMQQDNLFTPIESKRTFEEISSKVKALVFEGTLKPGDRLPSEQELAKQFGVGRQSVREALRLLELSGFVSIQKGYGGGPIVQDTISTRIRNLYLDAFRLEKISVAEFTSARMAIEKAILNEVIDKADKSDIKRIRVNLAKAQELIADKKLATDENFDFHALLARASKNKVFMILEKSINAIHKNLRSRSVVDFRTTHNAVKAHQKILDAIMKKDRVKALKLLERHILDVMKSY
jgi:GntR family transcriptional repressor for pyruvate dehydrogenase complex